MRLEAPRGNLRLQPGGSLGPEDVDPPVEEAAATRDGVLVPLELGKQRRQLVIGERQQVGERFHGRLSGREIRVCEEAA